MAPRIKDKCLKEEDKALLAPRLVRNLTGRAWECCLDIDREALKKPDGVTHLLDFLRDRRGKQQVDLLGDALQQYFQTADAFRREGENLNDYEQRHAVFVRDIRKAMLEIGCKETVPTEIYGWFAINKLLRLDSTDVAMVKAQAQPYKLDDVMSAMRKMWEGDSLSLRDAEKKRQGNHSKTFAAMLEPPCASIGHVDNEAAWMNTHEDAEPNDESDVEDALEESQAWFEQATDDLAARPGDDQVYANFQEARKTVYKEARKALDKHRVSRGFYPTGGKGKGKEASGKGFQGRCMRCGKIGHKAMQCRQQIGGGSGAAGSQGQKGADSGRVGFVFTTAEVRPAKKTVTWSEGNEVIAFPVPTYAALTEEIQTKAILDCGASESIIGAHTLQVLYEKYAELGMDPDQEITVDRHQRRSFVFGNNETSLALGFAHVSACIAGHRMKIPVHVVEGQTPFLLSSRWLEEHEAVINFKTGLANFRFLGDEAIQLERASTNHLLLPMTSFGLDLKGPMSHGSCSQDDHMSHCEAFGNRPEAVPT